MESYTKKSEYPLQRIQELRHQLADKEEIIRTQQRELEGKEEIIQRQHKDLVAREEVIQSLIVFQQSFSIRYWFWHLVRPFLKQSITEELHKALDVIYRWFRPTLYQYPPIPLNIPKRYSHVALPAEDLLPIVSIVTPSLNQAIFLENTIMSVLGQHYPKLEYVIQDGGSTDGSAHILETYRSKLTHVESCKDTGQADAINRGFRHAKGEIMAWLNSDDLLLPGAIADVVNYFLKHPEVDVLYGHRININEYGEEVGRRILPPHDNEVLRWTDLIPQETLFWRKRIWEKAGSYIDESYQFAMDWELLLRFREAGAVFVRLPRFLGAFRIHPAQKTLSWSDVEQQEKRCLYLRYHGRPVEWSETRRHIKYYLLGSTWRYILYRLGLHRY